MNRLSPQLLLVYIFYNINTSPIFLFSFGKNIHSPPGNLSEWWFDRASVSVHIAICLVGFYMFISTQGRRPLEHGVQTVGNVYGIIMSRSWPSTDPLVHLLCDKKMPIFCNGGLPWLCWWWEACLRQPQQDSACSLGQRAHSPPPWSRLVQYSTRK